LSSEFDQFNTIKSKESNLKGKPIPWFTYPAIEYLNQLDFSKKVIFEFGSGNSTIYWAERSKEVYSVEDNHEWYVKISDKITKNVQINFVEKKEDYISNILKYPDEFDVIIIDGKYRLDCVQNALKKLRPDGFIILDNSDWHEKASKLLRDNNLIEVDMSGFGPINNYTWTTSFYFKRDVQLSSVSEKQPDFSIGSLQQTVV